MVSFFVLNKDIAELIGIKTLTRSDSEKISKVALIQFRYEGKV